MATSNEIHTDRLLIKPFAEVHLSERYLGWLHDRELLKYSEQRHREHTLESCREYMLSFNGTGNYFWAIEDHASDWGHIGNVNAYIDRINRVADIGIMIGDKRVHGNGYGLESWKSVEKYLFDEVGVRKITAGMLEVNIPMKKLAEAAGMVPDGIRPRHFIYDGKEVALVHYAIFKDQWSMEAS